MTSFRKTALVGGILYLVTFVGSIPAAFLVGPALNDPNYVLGAGADQQVGLAAIFELVNVFGLIGCGIAFFSVVRHVHEGLAIGYLATRLFEGAIITMASSACSRSSRSGSRSQRLLMASRSRRSPPHSPRFATGRSSSAATWRRSTP